MDYKISKGWQRDSAKIIKIQACTALLLLNECSEFEMFADDLIRDFYAKIKGQRVLVVVNYDVDAICACKILQSLFKTDYITHTLVAIDFVNDLKTLFDEHHACEKYVIFINCGGTVDLIEEIQPEEDITFFILDSHRPLDVCNIYNDRQIVVLSKLDDSEEVPEFTDIFRDDDENNDSTIENDDVASDNADDDYDDGGGGDNVDTDATENAQAKRMKLCENSVAKRRERRAWEEKRDRLMFEYSQFGYYGRSSALVLFDLAWKLSKDNYDVLWLAIVGLSEQYLLNKISETAYVAELGNLQNHVSRLTHEISGYIEGESLPVHIEIEKDLRLQLYRHWSVKESLKHSKFSATKLKLWTFQGEERLHEMLAEIGIPLNQCTQKFMSMDLIFRKEFYPSLVAISEKYGLNGIVFVTFFIRHGYGKKYSAADYVYGLLALLQSAARDKTKSLCFTDCLEALRQSGKGKLDEGIELGKRLFMSVFKQTQNALEIKRVQRIGPILYFCISQRFVQTSICSHPYGAILLADFLQVAYATTRKNHKKALGSPMVICAPCVGKNGVLEEDDDSLCNIAGIPPASEECNKNFFGKAFEKAAEQCRIQIQATYTDSSVIQIAMKDVSKFIDSLVLLLS